MGEPVDRTAELQTQLETVDLEIDLLNLEADPSLISTAKRIAGLNVRRWQIIMRIARLDGKVMTEESASRQAINWAARQASLAAQEKSDLLPRLLAKMEEREKMASRLAGLR